MTSIAILEPLAAIAYYIAYSTLASYVNRRRTLRRIYEH